MTFTNNEITEYVDAGISSQDIGRYITSMRLESSEAVFELLANTSSVSDSRAMVVRAAIKDVLFSADGNFALDVFSLFGDLKGFFSDEDLYAILKNFHSRMPYNVYTRISKDVLRVLFPITFFSDLNDPIERKIFLHLYAGFRIEAFAGCTIYPQLLQIRDFDRRIDGVSIDLEREPTFACGKAEGNFREAAALKQGLIRINGSLLGKFYHTKIAPQKITIISGRDLVTDNGDNIVWADYIYAPSRGVHRVIQDSVKSGITEIEIGDICLRPIRPYIGSTAEIFDRYASNY